MQRTVSQVVTAHRQQEGAGFVVRRPLPTHSLELMDPFLLIDEMGPVTYGPREAVGAPDHPHRGFETVTYLLRGQWEHKDSTGRQGLLGPGDVQWMTAGAGVVHSEMPSDDMRLYGGELHGFQIWVNLPAALKMTPPRYQEITADKIPVGESGGARVRVVAGEALGVSAVIDTHTPIAFHHWTLQPGGAATTALDGDMNVGVYIFDGEMLVAGERLTSGQFATLTGGDEVALAVSRDADREAHALLLAGKPIGEPIARYGPFVMNTRAELLQAFDDYNAGHMGRISR